VWNKSGGCLAPETHIIRRLLFYFSTTLHSFETEIPFSPEDLKIPFFILTLKVRIQSRSRNIWRMLQILSVTKPEHFPKHISETTVGVSYKHFMAHVGLTNYPVLGLHGKVW